MPWYIIIFIVIGAFLGLGLFSAIFQLIVSIEKYFKSKTELNQKQTEVANFNLEKSQKSIVNVNNKISSTTNLITIINFIIDTEIKSQLYQYVKLNKEYPTVKADEDLLVILDRIQKIFKPEVYTYDEVVFNEEYIMTYITRQTTIHWLEAIVSFNASLSM